MAELRLQVYEAVPDYIQEIFTVFIKKGTGYLPWVWVLSTRRQRLAELKPL